MSKKTDFSKLATQYPNYFPGQYLLEADFELQHKYLSDRLKYHRQSLYVSGIVEGLEVEVDSNKKSVIIKAGSAIDNQGNLIVSKIERSFSEFNNLSEGELYLQYFQKRDTKQQDEIEDSYTRWKEEPTIKFAATTPEDGVKIAKLIISQGNIQLDIDIREYSGLSLPNSNGNALTIRSEGNINSDKAILSGSLQIDGDLTVEGAIYGKIDSNQIISGTLDVDRIPDLSANKITSGTVTGNLSISGAITPSVGNSKENGIMFPENPFGGSGDAAWIRYYRRGTTGEATTLEIGINNDSDDHIALMPNSGNVGIGTNNPASKLEVDGNIKAKDISASGNLTVTGTISGKIDANKINSGTLNVDRIPNLSADKITSGTVTGNLSISGATTPSVGNSKENGIMFPTNPGNGSGDAAWIRYYKRGTSGEATTLEIGTSDNADDHIALMPKKGNVGIGTVDPSEKLEVDGNIKAQDILIKSRRGIFKTGEVAADGKWHNILTDLNGHNGFEVIADAGKPGKHGLTHAIALSTYIGGDEASRGITKTQAYYGEKSSINIRWQGTTYKYNLQIGTLSNYGSSEKITYHITKLW